MHAEIGMASQSVPLQPNRRDDVARMLARIFDQDPHFNWLVRQDELRQEALYKLFQLLVEEMPGAHGEVHISADGKAVAIWYPPGSSHLPLPRQLAFLRAFLPISGWTGLPRRALGLQKMESKRPRQPHYYLQVIGVDGDAQGQGRGRGLMEPVLRLCDARHLPAYLETGNPRNLAFYEKMGFARTGSYRLPGGPELWQLLRQPVTEVTEPANIDVRINN
jgi:GNAT superfamily N-acetyltransferase